MSKKKCKAESEDAVMKAASEMGREYRESVRHRQAVALLGMALSLVVVMLCVRERPRSSERMEAVGARGERPELAEGGFTEGLDASVLALGVPLPKAPLANWRKPPCSQKQREINGACWKKLAATPEDDQCGEDYQYEGACWAPVAEKRKAPLSIDQ